MSEEKKLQIYDFIIQIQSIAKIGLKYSKDPYAIENYKKIEPIIASFIRKHSRC